jgi:hypothetical protein
MSCNISRTINSGYSHYGCNTISPDFGGRGITYWAYPNGTSYTLSPSQSKTITFTCTQPYCYEGKDWCNVHFKATPKGSATYNRLSFGVNSAYTQDMYLSGVPNNGLWQTYELANIPNDVYHDTGMNTIVLTNNSGGTIEIAGFKILRSYAMKHYNYTTANGCSYPVNHGSSGSLDPGADFPCHLTYCGRRSVTSTGDAVAGSIIPAGGCAEWVFNWSSYTSANYESEDVALFNFNQLAATEDTNQTDVTLNAYLNNSLLTTFYLSKSSNYSAAFPSYDMTTNANYHDTQANTVRLVNNSNVPIEFQDTIGINIYRVYKTESICPSPPCQTCDSCYSCQGGCQACDSCNAACYACNAPCMMCYSCYIECQVGCEVECQSGCEVCEDCEACEAACQQCVGCQDCQSCYVCQTCESCQPCYDCQSCYNCEPLCYDFQICYLCQENCYDCETCYVNY